MAVEEREEPHEISAGTFQRHRDIEQIGQAIGGRRDKAPSRRQTDQRVAGLLQRERPEASRQHQRNAHERRAQIEQAAMKLRFDGVLRDAAREQFFDGRQQGRRVKGVGGRLIDFCHVGLTA